MIPKQPYNTPILIIAFNRPDCLQPVLEQVKILRPQKLYIALDGPRVGHTEDGQAQELIKNMIAEIDWAGQLNTKYRAENLGCGYGPSEAISWVLEHEDRVVILEDDSVPNQSFFAFCDEMLEKYKDDDRIGIVSGRSHHPASSFFNDKDYLFTYVPHTNAWATWRRVWNSFDMKMSDYPAFAQSGGASSYIPFKAEAKMLDRMFRHAYRHIAEEVTHSWDTQALYMLAKNQQMGIVSGRNLVTITGAYGAHSFGFTALDVPVEDLPDTLRHPAAVSVDMDYEKMHYKYHLKKIHPTFWRKVYQYILRKISVCFH